MGSNGNVNSILRELSLSITKYKKKNISDQTLWANRILCYWNHFIFARLKKVTPIRQLCTLSNAGVTEPFFKGACISWSLISSLIALQRCITATWNLLSSGKGRARCQKTSRLSLHSCLTRAEALYSTLSLFRNFFFDGFKKKTPSSLSSKLSARIRPQSPAVQPSPPPPVLPHRKTVGSESAGSRSQDLIYGRRFCGDI